MHFLLARLLKKKGIEDVEELSIDDKQWFEEKQRILSRVDEFTVDSLKKFCRIQLNIIEEQWKNLDNAAIKNERLIMLHTVYSTILKVADASKVERELLEEHLQQLLK